MVGATFAYSQSQGRVREIRPDREAECSSSRTGTKAGFGIRTCPVSGGFNAGGWGIDERGGSRLAGTTVRVQYQF